MSVIRLPLYSRPCPTEINTVVQLQRPMIDPNLSDPNLSDPNTNLSDPNTNLSDPNTNLSDPNTNSNLYLIDSTLGATSRDLIRAALICTDTDKIYRCTD